MSVISKAEIIKKSAGNVHYGTVYGTSYDELSKFEGVSIDVLVRDIIELQNAGVIDRYLHLEGVPPKTNYRLPRKYWGKPLSPETISALCQESKKNESPVVRKFLGAQTEYKDLFEFNNAVKRVFEEKLRNNGEVIVYGRQFGRITDRILKMSIGSQWVFDDGCGFVFIWGFPGPDYNDYRFIDYGRTWTFTPEDHEVN